jgi:hypothetical protein
MTSLHAVFTIVQDDPVHLRAWADHYRRFYDAEHTYVLHHPGAGERWDTGWLTDVRDTIAASCGGAFHVVPVFHEESFDHAWLLATVESFQRFLLRSYATVLFTEIDEVVTTDPEHFDGTLADYCEALVVADAGAARCTGFEVVHDPDAEEPLEWTEPILRQRSLWYPSRRYCKTLLSRVPLSWREGFHALSRDEDSLRRLEPDPRLLLLHLHKADWPTALERHRRSARKRWAQPDLEEEKGWQNRIVDEQSLREWWFDSVDVPGERAALAAIPEHLKDVV